MRLGKWLRDRARNSRARRGDASSPGSAPKKQAAHHAIATPASMGGGRPSMGQVPSQQVTARPIPRRAVLRKALRPYLIGSAQRHQRWRRLSMRVGTCQSTARGWTPASIGHAGTNRAPMRSQLVLHLFLIIGCLHRPRVATQLSRVAGAPPISARRRCLETHLSHQR